MRLVVLLVVFIAVNKLCHLNITLSIVSLGPSYTCLTRNISIFYVD
jgi:hypothetical protein